MGSIVPFQEVLSPAEESFEKWRKRAGVSPVPPALGACIGASFGFMLPVSTPPNAIVYGSGRVPILSMMRAGLLFDTAGFFVIWGGLRIMAPIFGWD